MKKADNIFVRAKAYRKEHPRTSFQDAIKKVAGKKVSGAKPAKKIAGKPVKSSVAGTRKRRTEPARVATSRGYAKRTGTRLERAKEITGQINKLEGERSAVKSRDMKDIYAAEINGLHKKLDALKRA